MIRAHALVLVKERGAAKSRLATVLGQVERTALQDAMLDDVLTALTGAKALSGVSICSPDSSHAPSAARHGAGFIADPPGCGGMDLAAAHGCRMLAGRADLIVVLPGDLPLLDAGELDIAIAGAADARAVVVVPDRHGRGTNGLLFEIGAEPAFSFGPGSFRNHLGGRCPSMPMLLRSLALDIDTPDDLRLLLDADHGGPALRSRALLRSLIAASGGGDLLSRERT